MTFLEALFGLQALWQTQFFASLLLKTSALVSLAGLVLVALRGAPARERHLVLSAALVSLAFVPLVSGRLPRLEIAVPPSSVPVELDNPVVLRGSRARLADILSFDGVAAPSAGAALPDPGPLRWLALAWAAGAAVAAARVGAGTLRLRRELGAVWPVADVRRRDLFDEVRRELALERPVRLLEGARVPLPFTTGFLRPVVVLPTATAAWSHEWLRLVLSHELAHVRRRDWILQVLGRLLCVLYWFHPGVWWLVRRQRLEAEYACDRYAMAGVGDGLRYAHHLLEIAYGLKGRGVGGGQALAFLRKGELNLRVRAALVHPRRSRRRLVLALALMSLLLPVAALSVVIAPCEPVDLGSTSKSSLFLLRSANTFAHTKGGSP